MESQLSLRVVVMVSLVMVSLVAVTQVAGTSLLTKTTEFPDPVWTVACLAIYAGSLFLLAETIRQGMALSLIIPILAALVPLATIAVTVLVFREHASWLRLVLLSGACVLIGVAARV